MGVPQQKDKHVIAIKRNMQDQIVSSDCKILHCPVCGGEWSGNAGDYWDLPDDHVFTCDDCGVELELVEKRVYVEYV